MALEGGFASKKGRSGARKEAKFGVHGWEGQVGVGGRTLRMTTAPAREKKALCYLVAPHAHAYVAYA